jgi:hypothetical protein
LNSLGWIQPWCATTSSSAPTDSWLPLAASDTKKFATCLNGWKWSAFGENDFFLRKTRWRILKIRSGSGQSWPNFCPQRQLLTPHSTLILHLPSVYMSHTMVYFTLFPVGTPIPPHPYTLHHCFRGFTENNTHRRDGYSLKSNDFFGGRDSTPPCSNAISPSGSVMII